MAIGATSRSYFIRFVSAWLLVAVATEIQAAGSVCPDGGTLVAGTEDYRPYQIVEGTSVSGMDFEVLELILARMGCELEIRIMPWTRHLKGIEDGDVHAASPVAKSPEREEYAYFSIPYLKSREVLFVPPEHRADHTSLREFFEAGKILGAVRDYVYGGDFVALSKEFDTQITVQDTEEPMLKQVAIGRIDAVIGDAFVVTSVISQLGLREEVVRSTTVVSEDDVYFMFSKAAVSLKFIDRFNAELQQMQESGEFARITAKYL
ncbi:ABC-type amino acid transport substrate-binding protein [Roseibium hamelinense]|uniref:ABC-type amino acid transport substrate-binding protein n=1 Tax=Roseibium hamelinense TaxID=150831 RepID=A0A562THJ3_9HYPH|nr:transporter substrate-binding domain-containing protein [Roseibium hamelinense]MTI45732.1 amino acid ABC transporter substrate-binding protein [Roseibium hamelinense]TWI93085.1 ABC-type amino acid transport substrate-binding protein [Roseibium hamelinense]